MRVYLEQPRVADEFVAFLDRCNWRARRVATGVVDVSVPISSRLEAGRRLARRGRCIECGTSVADALAELGSLHCHDCRDAVPAASTTEGAGGYRVALEGYIKVWNALHPTATTRLVDGRGRESP